jgi:hypothetical protein
MKFGATSPNQRSNIDYADKSSAAGLFADIPGKFGASD